MTTAVAWSPFGRTSPTVPGMQRQVYPEPITPRDGPLDLDEPLVVWLLTSTRPEAAAARAVANDMYLRFPDPGGRMLGNLRSTDERRFYSALDELYIHDLLQSRYAVRHEEGELTRQDFSLYRDNEHAATIEVLTLLQRDKWTAEQRRHLQLSKEINERLLPTSHSVHMEIERWDGFPNVRHIISHLARSIKEICEAEVMFDRDDDGVPRSVFNSSQADIVFGYLAEPGPVPGGTKLIENGALTGGLIDSAGSSETALSRRPASMTCTVGPSPSW